MIRRYTRPEMGELFTDQKKFETWLAIEIAILEALADYGTQDIDSVEVTVTDAQGTVTALDLPHPEYEEQFRDLVYCFDGSPPLAVLSADTL